MVDLKGLANRLGLSPTTVSRALAGYADVSATTRERVVAAAREFRYTPNAMAKRLSSGKAEALGVVLPTASGHFADPFFLELLVGIGEILNDLDLIVTSVPAGSDELAAYRRLVEGRRVDGLLVARTRLQDERVAYLHERGFPFVTHGRTQLRITHAYLDVDGEAAFEAATKRLIALGHHRIALINGPEDLHSSYDRGRGHRAALAAAGLVADPVLRRTGDFGEASGERLAAELLTQTQPPTALLCANDMMAVGALKAIKQCGLRAGEDVAVIGYDDIPFAAYTEPPLATVRQSIRQGGARMAQMLLAQLEGTPAASQQELWDPELIERPSIGPDRSGASAPRPPPQSREPTKS